MSPDNAPRTSEQMFFGGFFPGNACTSGDRVLRVYDVENRTEDRQPSGVDNPVT